MAVKDGLGPRPVAQTAKRHFLNRLETSSQTLTWPPFLHCQLPPCSCPPGAGFRSAQLRSKLESKDPVAVLKHLAKHHVKDGLGPRPVAQTAKRHFLNRLETSSQTLNWPPFLHCQLPPCSCPPGAGFRSAATLLVSSWSWLSFCTASVQAGVQGPCRRAKTPWQWRTDWARGP